MTSRGISTVEPGVTALGEKSFACVVESAWACSAPAKIARVGMVEYENTGLSSDGISERQEVFWLKGVEVLVVSSLQVLGVLFFDEKRSCEHQNHEKDQNLHAEIIPRVGAEMIEERRIIGLLHDEGKIGLKNQVHAVNRKKIPTDDEKDAKNGLFERPLRSPIQT